MENLLFQFEGKTYTAILITSDSRQEYVWVEFNDDEISKKLGDSIAFYSRNGVIAPVYQYTRYASLVEDLRKKVEVALAGRIKNAGISH